MHRVLHGGKSSPSYSRTLQEMGQRSSGSLWCFAEDHTSVLATALRGRPTQFQPDPADIQRLIGADNGRVERRQKRLGLAGKAKEGGPLKVAFPASRNDSSWLAQRFVALLSTMARSIFRSIYSRTFPSTVWGTARGQQTILWVRSVCTTPTDFCRVVLSAHCIFCFLFVVRRCIEVAC